MSEKLRPEVAWRVNVWKNMKHPARPSKLNLKVYDSFIKRIKKNKNPNVLVLGSTPEIRELIIKNNLTPTVVDVSKDVYEALTHLMKRREKEIFIHSDWLKMPINIKYDLVIGDTAINMLRWKDFEKYLAKVHNILKQNGYYVERIPIKSKIKSDKEFLKRLDRARRMSKSLKKFPWFLSYDAYAICFPKNKDEIFFGHDLLKLRRFVKSGFMSEKEFEAFKILIMPLRYCPPIKPKFEKLARKYFSIKKIIYCKDPEDQENSPIYVMTKKSDSNGS